MRCDGLGLHFWTHAWAFRAIGDVPPSSQRSRPDSRFSHCGRCPCSAWADFLGAQFVASVPAVSSRSISQARAWQEALRECLRYWLHRLLLGNLGRTRTYGEYATLARRADQG